MLIWKKAQKKILDQQFCVFYFCSSTKRVENGRAGGPFVVLLAFMWPPLFSLYTQERKRSAPEFIIFTLCQSITRESRENAAAAPGSIRFSINTSCCTPRTSFLLPLNCTLSKLFGLCCFENNESSIDMQT